MGAASARLGSLGVGCRADGSRVPGSGQLSDAAAVLGWGGGRPRGSVDSAITGGRAQDRPRPRLAALSPNVSSREGTGSGRGPGLLARGCQAWLPPSGPRHPVHPGAERAAHVQPSGALPRAWGDRQGPWTPPHGPTPSATACVASSGGLREMSGSLRMCGDCAVGPGGGRQVGKAAVRFRTPRPAVCPPAEVAPQRCEFQGYGIATHSPYTRWHTHPKTHLPPGVGAASPELVLFLRKRRVFVMGPLSARPWASPPSREAGSKQPTCSSHAPSTSEPRPARPGQRAAFILGRPAGVSACAGSGPQVTVGMLIPDVDGFHPAREGGRRRPEPGRLLLLCPN